MFSNFLQNSMDNNAMKNIPRLIQDNLSIALGAKVFQVTKLSNPN